MKTCTKCGVEKPFDGFYFDSRKDRHRPSCIECCKVQSAANKKPLTAEQKAKKAAARRSSGPDDMRPVREYITRDEIVRLAAERRANHEAGVAQRKAERIARGIRAKPEEGSKAWYETATSEQIEVYRERARTKFQMHYASHREKQIARVRDYKARNPEKVKSQLERYKERNAEEMTLRRRLNTLNAKGDITSVMDIEIKAITSRLEQIAIDKEFDAMMKAVSPPSTPPGEVP
jgi:hypothetical protein